MGALKNRDYERFCHEYIIDHNGTKAATRAGYSEHTAAQQACRILKKPEVQERIVELEANICESLGLTAATVLHDLMKVAERCMQAVPVMEWNYELREMVATGEYQFDSKGANRALELLGQHLGMFGKGKQLSLETEDKTIRVTLTDD